MSSCQPSISRRAFLGGTTAVAAAPWIGSAAQPVANTGKISYARALDVMYETDVFVAGGGPAGVCAALAAARAGKRVFLAESSGSFGGAATAAYVPAFATFGDGVRMLACATGDVRRVAPAELRDRLRSAGAVLPA